MRLSLGASRTRAQRGIVVSFSFPTGLVNITDFSHVSTQFCRSFLYGCSFLAGYAICERVDDSFGTAATVDRPGVWSRSFRSRCFPLGPGDDHAPRTLSRLTRT